MIIPVSRFRSPTLPLFFPKTIAKSIVEKYAVVYGDGQVYSSRFRSPTLPLFFPKLIQKQINKNNAMPKIYDVDGTEIKACSSLVLHKFDGTLCCWCRRSKDDIIKAHEIQDREKSNVSLIQTGSIKTTPNLDFNSPTSATVNPTSRIIVEKVVGEEKQDLKPASMDLNGIKAYCTKCKLKVPVKNPRYEDGETRRGITRYLKGSCSICNIKVCAIVKRE